MKYQQRAQQISKAVRPQKNFNNFNPFLLKLSEILKEKEKEKELNQRNILRKNLVMFGKDLISPNETVIFSILPIKLTKIQ